MSLCVHRVRAETLEAVYEFASNIEEISQRGLQGIGPEKVIQWDCAGSILDLEKAADSAVLLSAITPCL